MTKRITPDSSGKLIDVIVSGIQEVKGNEIVCLDLRKIENAVTDYFVVCHGNSTTQVEAIARSIENETENKLNESPRHVEGKGNAQWVLMDYFNVMVHIFDKPQRDYYNLESLWADAPEIKI